MNLHKHEWHSREKHTGKGMFIQGYVCKCGAVDYVDMRSKYKSRIVNKDENLPGTQIIP